MSFGRRPDARIHFGSTGKPGVLKQVKRDEIGDLQLSVLIDTNGFTRIDFGRPITYIALPPDKAYDFAHLVLENVKDKQGGEPVNVTEEKIIDALEFALEHSSVYLTDERGDALVFAKEMLPHFMRAMAGEPEVAAVEEPGVPGKDTKL